MTVTAEDFMKFAVDLINGEDLPEIAIRGSMSRAYYAAFHACEPTSTELPDVPSIGGAHERLISKFTGFTGAPADTDRRNMLKRIGYMLNQCRGDRVIADYKLSRNLNKEQAEITISMANKVAKALIEYHDMMKAAS